MDMHDLLELTNLPISVQELLAPGAHVTVGQLIELNAALANNAKLSRKIAKAANDARTARIRKAAEEAGAVQQGTAFTGAVTPLIPQSLDAVWRNVGDSATKVVLWPRIAQVKAFSMLEEASVRSAAGDRNATGWSAEGAIPPVTAAEFARLVVAIKSMLVARHVTKQADIVRLIPGALDGVASGALAVQTSAAAEELLIKAETGLLWANADLSPNQPDGLVAAIMRNGVDGVHYVDNRGAALSEADITQDSHIAAAPEYGGTPTMALLDHYTMAAFKIASLGYGRDNRMDQGNRALYMGASGKLSVAGAMGDIELLGMPYQMPPDKPTEAALGDAISLSDSSITVGTPASHASSKFTASDAGDYEARIVAHGPNGFSAPLHATHAGAVTVGSGDRVPFTIADSALPRTGAGAVDFYRYYRADKNVVDPTEANRCWDFPRATSGNTTFYDANLYLPKTSVAITGDWSEETIVKRILLDLMRYQVPTLDFTVKMALALLWAPHIFQARRFVMRLNVKRGA